jgi:hypothetical protein
LLARDRLRGEPARARSSQDLWIGVSCGLLIASCLLAGLVVGSFDQEAFLEPGAGADEGDQVGCVDGAPPGLAGLDELNAIASPAAREPGPLVTPCRSLTVAKVRSGWWYQVDPVLGGVVIEGEQHVEVLGDLRDRLGR